MPEWVQRSLLYSAGPIQGWNTERDKCKQILAHQQNSVTLTSKLTRSASSQEHFMAKVRWTLHSSPPSGDVPNSILDYSRSISLANTTECVFNSLQFPSVLWRCWLGGRKGIRPVKNWVVGCWRGYLSGARCRLACGPLPLNVSCFSKVQISFYLSGTGWPG